MGYNFLRYGCDQDFLLPPDARDWLPTGHLSLAVIDAVGELDLSEFLAYYRSDGQGRPAYHPKMMTALVLYCYCKGIRSSRAVQMACFDDVGCRVITGNQAIDHAKVARFVRRHRDPLTGLFVQVLAVCAREGLVTVDLVAGDGTKVKANAAKAASRTLEELDVSIAELQKALEAEVTAWWHQADLLEGRPATMTYFITIAGRRWPVGTTFRTAKDALGWDQSQARTWDAINRHTALTALAQLRATAIRAALNGTAVLPAAPASRDTASGTTVDPADLQIYTGDAPLPARGGQPCPPGIPPIGLSDAETARIERLARDRKAGLISTARLAFHLRWSAWRRRHQARARWHHYSTRLAALAT